MKGALAAILRSLVLPAGATSGRRIVLDGVNGTISIFDTAGKLRDRLGQGAGLELFTGDASEVLDGLVIADVIGAGGTRQLALTVQSPDFGGGPAEIDLLSGSFDTTRRREIDYDATIHAFIDSVAGTPDIQLAGKSMPRGAIAYDPTSGTVVLSTTTGTFTVVASSAADLAVVANRSYLVEYWNNGSAVSGGAGNAVGDRWDGQLQVSTNSGGAWANLGAQKMMFRAQVAAAQRWEVPLFREIYKPGASSTTTRFRFQAAKTIGAAGVTSQVEGDHRLLTTDQGASI